MEYVNNDEHAAPSVKARYPLKEAEVEVRDIPGRAGEYRMIIRLCPHYQLDQIQGSIRLQARLSPMGQ
jgi:type VI secretion system protein ImpC